jgi:hypothetical protein
MVSRKQGREGVINSMGQHLGNKKERRRSKGEMREGLNEGKD